MPGPVYLNPDEARKMDPKPIVTALLLGAIFMASTAPGPAIIAADGYKSQKRPALSRIVRPTPIVPIWAGWRFWFWR